MLRCVTAPSDNTPSAFAHRNTALACRAHRMEIESCVRRLTTSKHYSKKDWRANVLTVARVPSRGIYISASLSLHIVAFATHTVLMCRCSIYRTGRTERKNPPSLAKKTADPYTLPRTRGGEGKWAADFSNFAEKAPSCRERPASTLRTDSSDGSDQAIAPRPGNAPTGRTTNLSRLGRLACAVFAANQQETE